MKRVFLMCAAALLGSAPSAWGQWPHVNDKVTRKVVLIRRALVLPAEVSFEKIGTRGSEGGATEADRIAASFYSSLIQELSTRGVTVLPNPIEQAKDDAARFAVAEIQSRYDTVAVQMRKKPDRVSSGRFTMGDRVARFEPGADADVLVFLRGAGHSTTAGRNALAAAMRGPAAVGPRFHTEVSFVDAKTGEVLLYFRFVRWNDMSKSPDERFRANLSDWLRDVPLPSPPPKK